jgi:hypothetical protein
LKFEEDTPESYQEAGLTSILDIKQDLHRKAMIIIEGCMVDVFNIN